MDAKGYVDRSRLELLNSYDRVELVEQHRADPEFLDQAKKLFLDLDVVDRAVGKVGGFQDLNAVDDDMWPALIPDKVSDLDRTVGLGLAWVDMGDV